MNNSAVAVNKSEPGTVTHGGHGEGIPDKIALYLVDFFV